MGVIFETILCLAAEKTQEKKRKENRISNFRNLFFISDIYQAKLKYVFQFLEKRKYWIRCFVLKAKIFDFVSLAFSGTKH